MDIMTKSSVFPEHTRSMGKNEFGYNFSGAYPFTFDKSGAQNLFSGAYPFIHTIE